MWNYGRGDGVEKALLLTNILHARNPDLEMRLETATAAVLKAGNAVHEFRSAKGLRKQIWPIP